MLCGHLPEGFLICESTASGAIQRRYAHRLGSNNILNQMNGAAATRATLDGNHADAHAPYELINARSIASLCSFSR